MARGPSLSSFTPSIGRGSVRGTPPPPARMRGAPTSRQKQKYGISNNDNNIKHVSSVMVSLIRADVSAFHFEGRSDVTWRFPFFLFPGIKNEVRTHYRDC